MENVEPRRPKGERQRPKLTKERVPRPVRPKKATATLHGKAQNIPKWAKDDDLIFTFRKENAKR